LRFAEKHKKKENNTERAYPAKTFQLHGVMCGLTKTKKTHPTRGRRGVRKKRFCVQRAKGESTSRWGGGANWCELERRKKEVNLKGQD